MPMSGFICHDNYLAKIAKLTDEQAGRLFRALMRYHSTGIIEELDGVESIAYDFIREDIDRCEEAYAAKCAKNRSNRMSGKRTTTNVDERGRTLTTDDDGQRPSTTVDERCQKEKEKEKDNIKEKEKDNIIPYSPPIDTTDDEFHRTQQEHNAVLEAAENAGFARNESTRAAIISLYAEYGLQIMKDGIARCVDAGVSRLDYLRKVLAGIKAGDKKPDKRMTPLDYARKGEWAHAFTQRTYTDDTSDMDRMMMEEGLCQ